MAAWTATPRQTYSADAIVGIEGGRSSLRPAMVQAAADAAGSRPILSRAAARLAGTGSDTRAAPDAATLAADLGVETGRVPGTLLIRAADADPERAAAIASAVAESLVADLQDQVEDGNRARDAADARRLAKLQDAAAEAHRRLTALGGDAVASTARDTDRVAALQARADAIKSILAAGKPPLGSGRDVPPDIAALQTSYLDLTRQLAKARESLGDRHTTVIGLRDAIKRASDELTSAWVRLAKTTEQDLATAKSRAGADKRLGGDAARIAALTAARTAAQAADEAVGQAQAALRDGEDRARWHLVARAPVPAMPEGMARPVRLAITAAAASGAAWLGWILLWRRRSAARAEHDPVVDDAAARPASEPTFDDGLAWLEQPAPAAPQGVVAEDDPPPEPETHSPPLAPTPDELRDDPMTKARPAAPASAKPRDLVATMERVLPAIADIEARSDVRVVLVAANQADVGTMDVALCLALAAAEQGERVLVVEGNRAQPELAAAVDPDTETALVQVFGRLRVVLRAECGEGRVYLAPSFRDGARLADELARGGQAVVADAIGDEFDLVVVDGDRAAQAPELARQSDAVLRVSRFASNRDDERFLEALDAPAATFLGTVAAAFSMFVPARRAEAAVPPARAAWAQDRDLGRHPLRADLLRRAG